MKHHVGFAKLDTMYKNSFTSSVIYNSYMKKIRIPEFNEYKKTIQNSRS